MRPLARAAEDAVKMRSLSERDLKTVRMGGLGAGAIVLYMLVISPAVDYWDRLNKDLAAGQSKLLAIQTSLDERVAAEKSLKELREKATVHTEQRQLNQQ